MKFIFFDLWIDSSALRHSWNLFDWWLSFFGGLWPLPAAGAPPKRENKPINQMNEWIKQEGNHNQRSGGKPINNKLFFFMKRKVKLLMALPASASGSPSSSCCAASQPITPINSPNQLVCWWRLIELFSSLLFMGCSSFFLHQLSASVGGSWLKERR